MDEPPADEPTPAQRLILVGCAFGGVAVFVFVVVIVIAYGARAL